MFEELPAKPEDTLPDSTSPYGPCPRCGRLSNFTVRASAPVTFETSGGYSMRASGGSERMFNEQVSILECQGCRQNTVVIEEQYVGGHRKKDNTGAGGVLQWRGLHWWPMPGMGAAHPDIPSAVSSAVAEAMRCLASNSPRAAAVMFRGALAEIVTEKGSETANAKHSLAAQLKQMSVDGSLDATLSDWADHIRALGNAGAHPNDLEPISEAEAAELGRLMTALLDYLYVHPASVRRAREAR